MTRPALPRGLVPGGPGRRFFRDMAAEYAFDTREAVLLAQAARLLDEVAALRALVAKDGELIAGSRGQLVAHPGLIESRLRVEALNRLLSGLDLPPANATADQPGGYSIASLRGRRAADARWNRDRSA